MASESRERTLLKRAPLIRKAEYRNKGLEALKLSFALQGAGADDGDESGDSEEEEEEKGEEEGKEKPFLPPIDSRDEEDEDGEEKVLLEMEEVLDAVLPPKEVEVGGEAWLSRPSRAPGTRVDLVELEWRTERLLRDRGAKEFGICPVRRHIFDQLFEELLRQVTVECAERGLLLLRVKDELRLSLASYQALYESAIAFGIRKLMGSLSPVLPAASPIPVVLVGPEEGSEGPLGFTPLPAPPALAEASPLEALAAEDRFGQAEELNRALKEEAEEARAKRHEAERELREQRRTLQHQHAALSEKLQHDNHRLTAANTQLQEQILELIKPTEGVDPIATFRNATQSTEKIEEPVKVVNPSVEEPKVVEELEH